MIKKQEKILTPKLKKMSQITKRPIRRREIREISERFEALPMDLIIIIQNMINQEYFHLRDLSEEITNAIIEDTIKSQFINTKLLDDIIHNILESAIGYTVFEFFDKYTYYYDNPRTSNCLPQHIPGSTILTKGFINSFDIVYYISYILELILDQILSKHKRILINLVSDTRLAEPIITLIIQYIRILFIDGGYVGDSLKEIVNDYNDYI